MNSFFHAIGVIHGSEPVDTPSPPLSSERGSALIMVLVVTLVVGILAMVGTTNSTSDSNQTATLRQGSQGFYAGESGIFMRSSDIKGKSYSELVGTAGVLTDPDNFVWPSNFGDDSTGWRKLDSPKAMYQAYLPNSSTTGCSRSKFPGEFGVSVRSGAAIGGISNSVLETSRLFVRSQGFSPNVRGQIESRIEQYMISYLPVQP